MMRTGHHAVGEDNDDELISNSCTHCHVRLHEGLRELGVDFKARTETWPEQLVVMLVAAGDFLIALGHRVLAWGLQLARFLEALDDYAPRWRDLPEAGK
jgi:hypothetical protein